MTGSALITFAGGVGLFLLGMKLMTDGLKVAAGETLRHILARWTSSLGRGVAAGMLVTALVQSSSAVVFAVIGFVNAGLLTLAQAVGVIYGAGIGTTMTSWVVAVVGFNVDLKAVALPAIALGMLLHVLARGRRAALGEALAGFGVFFLGIDVLKSAFAGPDSAFRFERLPEEGMGGRLAFVLIGVLLTVAMQSSSAAIAVTLTAVAGGLVTVAAGAALIVGANIGTTSTGLLAVVGATASARRAAVAHLAFTLAGGVAALALFPVLLWLAQALVRLTGTEAGPAAALAVFHTLIALLGVLVMLPLTPRLTRWLEARFASADEDRARPRHLDDTVLAMPALALDALVLETRRIGGYARAAAINALGPDTPDAGTLARDARTVDALALAAGSFASRVQQADLPPDLAEAFPQAVRVTQYYVDLAERAREIASLREGLKRGADEAVSIAVAEWRAEARRQLEKLDPAHPQYSRAAREEAMRALFERYECVKDEVLRAGVRGRLPPVRMAVQLDELSLARRALDQALKAARYTDRLMARALGRQHDDGGRVASEPAPGERAATHERGEEK